MKKLTKMHWYDYNNTVPSLNVVNSQMLYPILYSRKVWQIASAKLKSSKLYTGNFMISYLSRGINSAAAHILNGPSTMQVMDPPKLNTR